jgi:SpoVK/Ycf46/Vps4 family AAA+-type ATPase
MSTRRKKIKISQNFVSSNKIVQKGGNIHAQELLDILEDKFKGILGDEINESQILYQNAKYYYSAGEYSGALVSFACASVLLNTIMRRLTVERTTNTSLTPEETTVLDDTITKTENVLNCCLISVEELQAIVKNNSSSGKKDDDDNKPKEWEKICVKIQPLVFKKGSSNCIFYDDVIGLESQKDQIEHSFVFPLLYPNLYPKVSKGILIYGPPGTGKTLIVKAAVNQLQARSSDVGVLYFTPSPGDLKGKYVGETEKKIEEWFMCASQKACDQERDCNGKKFISIIFMDEIDSIARDRSQDSSGLSANSVNTLLQMMDGINSKENVAVIGATNYPWDLDSAILRRFDTQILIGLPEREDKKKLLDYEVNRYLDLKLKISTVCDKKTVTDASEQLNNDNAEKCGIQCERVKESPHINDPFIKQFSIDYYTDLEKETDPTKLSRVGGIINILEEKNFTNSDISRYVKTAARRAGELAIKCNIFYNTSIVGDISEKNADRYMSSLTRIADETQAIRSSIEILESFKQSKEHNKIYQIEPPKISIIQYNGNNYYNMKCILCKNSDMIMDFPLLQNMFIKGEKISSLKKITEDEYKKQILNQGASDATDIIMSFNVNFEESKVATKTPSNTSGLPGVQLFVSQLVNSVYSSVIGVYFGDPKNLQNKNDPNHIPDFFDNSNYTYKDDTGAVETQINSNLNKIILNKCNFDFFSFLLLSNISENNLINNTATYCDELTRELGIGKIEKAKETNGTDLTDDNLRDLLLVDDAKIVLKEEVKIKSGEISFFYPKGTGTDVFIQYKNYIKLINYFDVYSKLFPIINADISDEQYIKIPMNLFCLLFYEELNGQIPLYKAKPIKNSEILLIQLYLNSALRLVINYEKNSDYVRFSKCMLVKFLEYFTEIDLIEQYLEAAVKEKKVNDKEILAKANIDRSVKEFKFTTNEDAVKKEANLIIDAAGEYIPNKFSVSSITSSTIGELKTVAQNKISSASVTDKESAKKIINEAAEDAKKMIDTAVASAKKEIITALESEKEIVKNVNTGTKTAKETLDTSVKDFKYTDEATAKADANKLIDEALKKVNDISATTTTATLAAAAKGKISKLAAADEASAKKMINQAAEDAKKMINEAVKAKKTDISGKVVTALGNLLTRQSAPLLQQSATFKDDAEKIIEEIKNKRDPDEVEMFINSKVDDKAKLYNKESVKLFKEAKDKDAVLKIVNDIIDEKVEIAKKIIKADADFLKINFNNYLEEIDSGLTEINTNFGTFVNLKKQDVKNIKINNNDIDKYKDEVLAKVQNVNTEILNDAYEKVYEFNTNIKNIADLDSVNRIGGSRRSSIYRKRKQNGGALDNDIMTYIFRVILQEKHICDSWYLFYDSTGTFKDFENYDATTFNNKFDSVYTNNNPDPNKRLLEFYNEQQALINNTNVGDIHTKEIFLATKFNFNAIYELNKPNVISYAGKSISKMWSKFKNLITSQATLSTEDQKSADNATLMNELVQNNQLISVLFKEITAYGFLFDDNGESEKFKVRSDNGADSEKFIKVSWKSVELGYFAQVLNTLKQQVIGTSSEVIIGALLGYGAISIGSVTSYLAATGFGAAGLATVGLAATGLAAGGLAAGGLIAGGLAASGIIGEALGATSAGAAVALATGYGAGALASGAFGSWIVISNLYKFFYSDIDAAYIINNIFITTLLNIITTVGKFSIDFNKNLLDEVYKSINKVIYDNIGGVIMNTLSLLKLDFSRFSTSNTGFILGDFSSIIMGNKTQENLTITRFKKTGITKKDINYSLFNINIPFQAFYYALIHVKSSYNDQLGKDLIDYNTNRDKFLADKEKRDKEKKK